MLKIGDFKGSRRTYGAVLKVLEVLRVLKVLGAPVVLF